MHKQANYDLIRMKESVFLTALMEFEDPAVPRMAEDLADANVNNAEVRYRGVEPADTIQWSNPTNHFRC